MRKSSLIVIRDSEAPTSQLKVSMIDIQTNETEDNKNENPETRVLFHVEQNPAIYSSRGHSLLLSNASDPVSPWDLF